MFTLMNRLHWNFSCICTYSIDLLSTNAHYDFFLITRPLRYKKHKYAFFMEHKVGTCITNVFWCYLLIDQVSFKCHGNKDIFA